MVGQVPVILAPFRSTCNCARKGAFEVELGSKINPAIAKPSSLSERHLCSDLEVWYAYPRVCAYLRMSNESTIGRGAYGAQVQNR